MRSRCFADPGSPCSSVRAALLQRPSIADRRRSNPNPRRHQPGNPSKRYLRVPFAAVRTVVPAALPFDDGRSVESTNHFDPGRNGVRELSEGNLLVGMNPRHHVVPEALVRAFDGGPEAVAIERQQEQFTEPAGEISEVTVDVRVRGPGSHQIDD